MYYGDSTEHRRFTYRTGDTVNTDGLLFTPDPITVDGALCPFVKWVYEDTDISPEAEITVGVRNIILVAVYDYSAVPPKKHITQNADGSLTATGNVAHEFLQKSDGISVYSAAITFTKSMTGACGIAFRMDMSGANFAFEDPGSTYIAAGIMPGNGNLQICTITDGKFAQLPQSPYAFEKLPTSFRNKYSNAINICIELAVVDRGESFEIYIDRELAYTYANAAALSAYTGDGLGIRCSTRGAEYEDLRRSTEITVSFESNGGTLCAPVKYVYGKLALPESEKADVALGGWYYDEQLTQKVNGNKFYAPSDITLYAKWVTDYHTVTLDTDGGDRFDALRYSDGSINLPTPKKENYIFTGWYYDTERTREVDEDVPLINGDITLYAGYRLPYGAVTDNKDGTFTTDANTATLFGVGKSANSQTVMNVTFGKGASGAVGILFRGIVSGDNAWETNCKYIAAQVVPASGNIQICRLNNGFGHFAGTPIALANAPAAWQAKFNAAQSGQSVTVQIKVICLDDSFKVYIDGEPVYESADSNYVGQFTGLGYGIRSSSKNAVFSIDHDDIFTVRYYDGETALGTEFVLNGEAPTKQLPDGNVKKDEGGYYIERHDGWYTESTGGEKIESVTSDIALYAHYVRVPVTETIHTVDYVTNVGGMTIPSDLVKDGAVLVLPRPEHAGHRFMGWFTDEALTAEYDGDPVNSSFTLYAKWTETVTVTFSADGKEIDRVTVDKGAAAPFPSAPTKPTETAENGNEISYVFDGWYAGGSILNADSVFDADTEATAVYTRSVSRNGAAIVTDENGDVSYVFTGSRSSKQGITVPDVQMDGGEFSYTLTLKSKPSKAFNIRTIFYVDDANNVNITGTGNQAVPFINFNAMSGGVMVGKKIKNSSVSFFSLPLANIKDCEYKTAYSSVAAGKPLTLNFKIVFERGKFKYYINDCLIIVYGGMDHTGETLYGTAYTSSSATVNSGDAALKEFDAYINAPTGFAVGFQMWEDTANAGGNVTVTDVVYNADAAENNTGATAEKQYALPSGKKEI